MREAIERNDLDKLNRRLARGAIPDADILSFAVERQNPDIVTALVASNELIPEASTLTSALRRRNTAIKNTIIRAFSAKNIAPEARALADAIYTGNAETVRQVGQLFEDTNTQPQQGTLSYAIEHRHADIIQETIDVCAATNLVPKKGDVSSAFNTFDLTIIVPILKIFKETNTQPYENTLIFSIIGEDNTVIQETIAVYAATKLAPKKGALNEALATFNPAVIRQIAQLFKDTNTQPEPQTLTRAFSSHNCIENIQEIIAVYAATNQVPEARALEDAISTNNPAIIKQVAQLFQDINMPIPPESLIAALENGNPPREGQNLATAIKAYATYKALPEGHPLHEQSLTHIMQTVGADVDFLKREETYKRNMVATTLEKSLKKTATKDIGQYVSGFLAAKDVGKVALLSKAHKEVDQDARKTSTTIGKQSAAGFAAQERAKQAQRNALGSYSH